MSKTKYTITVWWPQSNGAEPHEVQTFEDAELLEATAHMLQFSPANSGGEVQIISGIPWRVTQRNKR